MQLETDHDSFAVAREARMQAEDVAKQTEQLHKATEAELKLHQEKGKGG